MNKRLLAILLIIVDLSVNWRGCEYAKIL